MKSSYSNKQAANNQNVSGNASYTAPSTNYSGNDMADFLPFN